MSKLHFSAPKMSVFFKSKLNNWLRPLLPLEYQIDFLDAFRNLRNVYDLAFLWKKKTAKRSPLSPQKSSIIDVWQDSKYANSLNFKKFSIQFTLHQGLNFSWIKLLSMHSWQNFKTSANDKLSLVSKIL